MIGNMTGISYHVSAAKSGIVSNIDTARDYACFRAVPAREWWKELRVLWKLVRLVLKALPTDAAESEGPAAEVH